METCFDNIRLCRIERESVAGALTRSRKSVVSLTVLEDMRRIFMLISEI